MSASWISEITTETRIANGSQGFGDWYDGLRDWSLTEAFAQLKKLRINDLAPRDEAGFESFPDRWTWTGLDKIYTNCETLKNAEVIALWCRARCNEIHAQFDADESMTWQSDQTKLAGAKRQIVSRV